MPRYKTRRARRYQLLRNSGFLPFEAMTLSKIPLKIPFFDILVKERFKRKEKAIKEGWTKKRYTDTIKKDYTDNNWMVRKGKRILPTSVYNMFRHYEDAYRQKYPNYTSPWEKRRKDFMESTRAVETSVKKNYAQWIKELDQTIAHTSNPARIAQLKQQKKNLETWL